MGLFSRFFEIRSKERHPMRRCCQVHYITDRLVVSAMHRAVDGMTPNGEPMFLLTTSESPTCIGESVLAALQGVRDGLTQDESVRQMCGVLALTGEPAWETVEKQWDMISVIIEGQGDEVAMYPMHRHRAGGYVRFKDDPVYRAPTVPKQVGLAILSIVKSPPLGEVQCSESHT
ncbi:MAG: hypothetical protein GC159_24385 [Phycisphaera sp.]|nr:hypothetical protein [Phycisphaera sp.]